MKKVVLSGLILLTIGVAASGAPARRGIIKEITQPDGSTVSVSVVGDERAHLYITADGRPLLRDDRGYMCYATFDDDGVPVPSEFVARDGAKLSAAEKDFIRAIDIDAVGEAVFNHRRSLSPRRRSNPSAGIGLDPYLTLFPHTGEPHALVILVEYSDVKFITSDAAQYFEEFLNKEGFDRDGGTGSCRDYFTSSSTGQFKPHFDLYGPVTLPHNQAYYGANDAWGIDLRAELQVVDAMTILDDSVDFSVYDLDNDGYIDNVYIIYAGKGENSYGSVNTVWPHRWTLDEAGTSFAVDGKIVNDYGCCNEYDYSRTAGIGTFCHEFGHVMGLPDLYATTYNNARYATPGNWDVMDHGSYNNDGRTPPSFSSYERNAMGWIDLTVLDGPDHITLGNIHDTNEGAIVLTDNENEFFLFENRQKTGWDKYLPGHGMIVWHIDYDVTAWSANEANNVLDHQCIDIEEAGGKVDNRFSDYLASYPFPGTSNVTQFTDDTSPSMRSWDGSALDKPITNIVESGGVISFDVCGGLYVVAPVATHSDVTPGGFTINWDKVSGAASYLVDVYIYSTAGEPQPVSGYESLEVTATSCAVARLDAATTYYYTVRAKNKVNTSAPSSEGSVTTAPREFGYVVPRVDDATEVTKNSFTANWQAVPDAIDYLLTVSVATDADEPEPFTLPQYDNVSVGNVLTKTIADLPDDAALAYYSIIAVNADGDKSLASDLAEVVLTGSSSCDDIIVAEAAAYTVSNGIVTITAQPGTDVALHDISGRLIASATVAAGQRLQLRAPGGVLILTIGNEKHKIAVSR